MAAACSAVSVYWNTETMSPNVRTDGAGFAVALIG